MNYAKHYIIIGTLIGFSAGLTLGFVAFLWMYCQMAKAILLGAY